MQANIYIIKSNQCTASEKVYQPHNLQYPRAVAPEFFADHIGNLTVELVLASVEISTLLIRIPPTLETLAILREAEAFPGNDPEGISTIYDLGLGARFLQNINTIHYSFVSVYYPEVPMLTSADNKQITEGQAESKTTALQPSTTQSTELDDFSNDINSVNQPRVLRATSLPSFHPSMDTIANDQVRSLILMFLRLR